MTFRVGLAVKVNDGRLGTVTDTGDTITVAVGRAGDVEHFHPHQLAPIRTRTVDATLWAQQHGLYC